MLKYYRTINLAYDKLIQCHVNFYIILGYPALIGHILARQVVKAQIVTTHPQ
jgi:hypothetical protein